MVPGICLFTFLGRSILDVFRNPAPGNVLILLLALVLPAILAVVLQRLLAPKSPTDLPTA
jgi:ABC-type polysaccharide transport system permease subunit